MNPLTLDSPADMDAVSELSDSGYFVRPAGEAGEVGESARQQMPDELSDGELMARAGRGDRGAFDDLTRRYYRQAVAISYKLVGDAQDAMDVAQEAFFRAYTSLDDLDRPEAFGGWLMRIVSNLSLNLRRNRRVRRAGKLDGVASGSVAVDRTAPINPRDAPDPVRASQAAETAERLRAALDALPAKQREVLVLFTIQGLSQKQVAENTGLTVDAVKWNVYQGRKRIKEELGDVV